MNTLEGKNGEWYVVLNGDRVHSEPIDPKSKKDDILLTAKDVLKRYIINQ